MPTDRAPDAAPTVGALFERPPFQWGLRGDTYVWSELRERFAATALPGGVFELRSLIQHALDDAVGQKVIHATEPIYVPRLDPGHGMSAGQVDPAWWAKTGIPILVDRYQAAVERDGRP